MKMTAESSMTMIREACTSITPVDASLLSAAQARLDVLTKPMGSLGRLEEFARRLVAMSGDPFPQIPRKAVFTFAGDHGVTDEGVSLYPKEVTPQMVLNFLRGGAGINVLARQAGADVVVVDIGVAFDFDDAPALRSEKVVRGTQNMRRGPALTRDEAQQCIAVGIGLASEYADRGYRLFGTGDMGIGNTTPSAAIAALLALGRAHEGANDMTAARKTYLRGIDVAAAKGDLATANKMQERLTLLNEASSNG